jgi:two-component system LytT family response regulator/two-component system response regulator LytT
VLKILIIDDELPARDELRYLVSQEVDTEVVGDADNVAEAVGMAASLQPDVIFLDINMREMNGLDAAAILRKVVGQAMIVFATAYDEFALKAFEVGAVDYILKPFEQERISKTIARLKNYQPEEWNTATSRIDTTLAGNKVLVQKLPVEKSGKIILLNYSEIIYAYANNGMVSVVTENEELNYSGTLSELQERVENTTMIRVHKSYIVNLDQVKEVVPWFKGTYWLKMNCNCKNEIPVSKSQIKEIKTIFGLK